MQLTRAVTAASAAVDRLASVQVDQCDATSLRAELRRAKLVQSKLEAQIARLTHAADASGAFIGTGARDTAEWLGKETGTSTRRNRSAAHLGEAMAKSDELTHAVTSGRLSADQAASAVGLSGGEALDAEATNCVLLCHRHHQLSHQPGWSVTGTADELRIQYPDGSFDVSRPPPLPTPLRPSPTRADPIGRASSTEAAPWLAANEQLTLA